MWLSISPGMTALPPRSIRLVFGPASRVISWLVPTATMRSPRIATACAIVKRSSTVMIFPFDRTRSACPAEALAKAGRRLLRADHRARAGNREQRTDGRDVRGQACHRVPLRLADWA